MSCDAGRPCSRCVKRDIAHLCRDEPTSSTPGAGGGAPAASASPSPAPAAVRKPQPPTTGLAVGNSLGLDTGAQSSAVRPILPAKKPSSAGSLPPTINTNLTSRPPSTLPPPTQTPAVSTAAGLGNLNFSFTPQPQPQQVQPLNANFNLAMLDLASGQDGMGTSLGLDMFDSTPGDGEFHGLGLSEFLQSLNDSPFLSDPIPGLSSTTNPNASLQSSSLNLNLEPMNQDGGAPLSRRETVNTNGGPSVPGSPINKTERFLLTAADQKDGSRSDRLARVIHAKFEAGLLRPYNHVAGYTRLMRWMGDNMSQTSRQRTLRILSEFRPAFRAIASGLTDLDLVFIEEAFERLLLDYDRVFSSMGIPSCLWRRTGEIYKGNKEFADLVGVPIEQLSGGKLAIYELMAEESAVNYWEKYGNIAFDAGQKAVLTSCVLFNQTILSKKRKRNADKNKYKEEATINCCFSFTIRRDNYAIPSMIVGNFLPY
ncbi:Zn(2)-C6 fungal-type transcription factor [Pseudohyphozyma bogoriensis]|nr:Zn(2)-C6 fungal-type transcription factor [Pseudohyphozyma bogoriensis]